MPIDVVADPSGLLASIKAAGMKAGMAIKPATPVQAVKDLLPSLDYLLVMTVEPGFGGQKLMRGCVQKVLPRCRTRPGLSM